MDIAIIATPTNMKRHIFQVISNDKCPILCFHNRCKYTTHFIVVCRVEEDFVHAYACICTTNGPRSRWCAHVHASPCAYPESSNHHARHATPYRGIIYPSHQPISGPQHGPIFAPTCMTFTAWSITSSVSRYNSVAAALLGHISVVNKYQTIGKGLDWVLFREVQFQLLLFVFTRNGQCDRQDILSEPHLVRLFHLAYSQFQLSWLLFSCMFFDLLAGKILRGQVDHAVGSVNNAVELVQRLSWISVVYGSPCTVGGRIMRVKSHQNRSYLSLIERSGPQFTSNGISFQVHRWEIFSFIRLDTF